MPRHMRLPSDLGPLMPGIVRHTDASGATVYSSHSYQPMKGHARGASAYSQASNDSASNDSEDGLDDPPSAALHDMENHGARLEDEH